MHKSIIFIRQYIYIPRHYIHIKPHEEEYALCDFGVTFGVAITYSLPSPY